MKPRMLPTVLVVFGATGDLMSRKIAPALFHLFGSQELPELCQVIGFSRRSLSSEEFRNHILGVLQKHKDVRAREEKIADFLGLFLYQQGFFENTRDYQGLAEVLRRNDAEWQCCANKLFYLAVPPQFYETILQNLAASGLTEPCGPEEGWTRILVEKPFGKDLETAEKLDKLLGRLFKEEQIYRIDHYLAKEMVQNILTFRFSNNLFEGAWSNKYISKIQIRLLESTGAEGRGSFYDGLGALRDVGQNHALQMLALVTMDHPASYEADAVRPKRAEILTTLRRLSLEEIKRSTFRAQYYTYRSIRGVDSNSNTETYFKATAFLESPRWREVPIFLESGKRLGEQRKEIVVTFRHPMPCLCPQDIEEHYQNKIVFTLEPKEGVIIHFWAKKPGMEMLMEKRVFDLFYRRGRKKTQYIEEYEKILVDCIVGDQTLFVATDEITAMWNYVDPVVRAWQEGVVPLNFYAPDSREILTYSKSVERMTAPQPSLKRIIGMVGLGKMGAGIARQLMEKNWLVVGFNRTAERIGVLEKEGLIGARSIKELVEKLAPPRIVWLMVTSGRAADEILFGEGGLTGLLSAGDIVVDGGNSLYKDSVRRAITLAKRKIEFVDVGVSGGPEGARFGASLMVGGRRGVYEYLLPLFTDLSADHGVQFFEGAGAGHFVKMVHNGIEYGMMQAIAEGFTILRRADFKLDLKDAAKVYNHGSVIESRLVGWLEKAFELHSEELSEVSGTVAHTGEAEWTVEVAKELGVKARVIEEALKFRIESERNPSYTGKILSALREQFGGHSVKIAKTELGVLESDME